MTTGRSGVGLVKMRGFARTNPLGDLNHPQCACGYEMRLSTIEPQICSPRTSVHTFVCSHCSLQLKVLHDEPEDGVPGNPAPSLAPFGSTIEFRGQAVDGSLRIAAQRSAEESGGCL
jgi:hypothetical protein